MEKKMKSLNELIDAPENADVASKTWCAKYSSPGDFEEFGQREAFHAGHRACFDLLAPALKAAVDEAEKFDCGSYVEEAIRAILEGWGE